MAGMARVPPCHALHTQGREVSEISREELVSHFDKPAQEAAAAMRVGLTVFKRLCRKFGVPRWPYRARKSLSKLIDTMEVGMVGSGSSQVGNFIYMGHRAVQMGGTRVQVTAPRSASFVTLQVAHKHHAGQ